MNLELDMELEEFSGDYLRTRREFPCFDGLCGEDDCTRCNPELAEEEGECGT